MSSAVGCPRSSRSCWPKWKTREARRSWDTSKIMIYL